jgi:hypothetical protein
MAELHLAFEVCDFLCVFGDAGFSLCNILSLLQPVYLVLSYFSHGHLCIELFSSCGICGPRMDLTSSRDISQKVI